MNLTSNLLAQLRGFGRRVFSIVAGLIIAGSAALAQTASNYTWVGAPTVTPSWVAQGGVVTVAGTLKNSGPGSGAATETKIQIKNSAGVLITSATVATQALGAGSMLGFTGAVTIPASTPAGSYVAYLVADNRSVLVQTTSAGNYSAGGNFTVTAATAPPKPANPSPANGSSLSYTSTVNLGWSSVSGATYTVFLDGKTLTATLTANSFTVSAAPGSHTWSVSSTVNGQTADGPLWAFSIAAQPVTTTPSTTPTNPNPTNPSTSPSSTPAPSSGATTGTAGGTTTTLVLDASVASGFWTTDIYSYTQGLARSGALDGRLRNGGWGDHYMSFLQFSIAQWKSPVRSAKLRLYPLADDGTPTALRLGRVTSPWTSGPTIVSWSNQPTTVDVAQIPAPTPSVWTEIDVTDLVNSWITGTYPNYGVSFTPVSNNNNYSTFAGPTYADATKRPQLVVVTDQAVPSTPDKIVIASSTVSGFVVQPGIPITIHGQVLDQQGHGVAGVSVSVSDSVNRVSRPVGQTDANGNFTDSVAATAAVSTGNYALLYSAGSKSAKVVVVVVNIAPKQLVLPGAPFDFQPGPVSTEPQDLGLYCAPPPGSQFSNPGNASVAAAGNRYLDAVRTAGLDELKKRAGDPTTYILLVADAACLVPQIAVAAAPACAVVFDITADEGAVSAFRIIAHSAVYASSLSDADKKVVNAIIDTVLDIRSAVKLGIDGSITPYDLMSQTWTASQTLIEIERDSAGRVTNVDISGTSTSTGSTNKLRITPVTPFDPNSVNPPATSTTTPASSTSSGVGSAASATGNSSTPSGSTTPPSTSPPNVPSTTGSSSGTSTGITAGGNSSGSTTTSTGGQSASTTTSGSSSTGNGGNGTNASNAVLTLAGTQSAPTVLSRFDNLSILLFLNSGGSAIGGFHLNEGANRRVLVRAIGPTLSVFQVSGALSDPVIELRDSTGALVATAQGWGSDLSSAFSACGAFALPAGSQDSAVVAELGSGSYTAQVKSRGGVAGWTLLEFYLVP